MMDFLRMHRVLIGVLLAAFFCEPVCNCMAMNNLSESQFEMFTQNNITFYDPTDSDCNSNSGSACVPPTGDKITWIGDSYSVGAQSIIQSKFPGISFGGAVDSADSTIQGCKFVSKDTSCNAKPTNPSGLDVLQRVIDAGELKPYLVFAMGTNGGWSSSDIEAFKTKMSAHPDTKVVLVTSKTPSDNYSDSNARLKELAGSNNNYYLADYADIAKDEWYAKDPDHIHPTTGGGYEAWVEKIEEALPKDCATTTLLPGTTTAEKVWNWWINYFTEAGLENVDIKAVTAGIMGNFMVESGINPFLHNGDGWGIHMNLTNYGGSILKKKVDEAVGDSNYWYFDGWWTDETTADSDYKRRNISQDAVDKAIDTELSLITNTTDKSWQPYSTWKEFMTGLRTWGVADTPRGYADLFEAVVERAVNGDSPIEDPAVRSHYGGYYQDAEARRDKAEYIYNKYANYSATNPAVGSLNVTGVKANDEATVSSDGKNYAGDVVWTEEQLAKVNEYRPVYEAAAQQYGIPWQAIATMHRLETGMGLKNPSNGQGLYQLYSYTNGGTNSRAFRPAGEVTMEEFKRQTMIAAEVMRGIIDGGGYDPMSDEGIKYLLFSYNGRSKKYIQKALAMGFSQAEANVGEGSPYVMNRYDAKRDPRSSEMSPLWPGRYVADGVYDNSSTMSDFGGFVLYSALGGGGASSGGVSICSDDSTAAKMAGEGDLPIYPLFESSVDIACDSRTIDAGVQKAKWGNNWVEIRLCEVPNIKNAAGKNVLVNSRVAGAFYAFAEAHNERYGAYLTFSEGFRSYETQRKYCYDYGWCATGRAAKPGSSRHELGLAIDFDTSKFYYNNKSLCQNMKRGDGSIGCYFRPEFTGEFGLRDNRRLKYAENWHIEAYEGK